MSATISRAVALLAAASRCDSLRPCSLLEIAAFAAREKPALRFVLAPDDENHFSSVVPKLGMALVTTPVYLEPRGGSWFSLVQHKTNQRRTLVVIAPDEGADLLMEAECTDVERAGDLLGYPRCCVKAFQRLSEHGGQWGQALAATVSKAEFIDARCNRYAAEWGGVGLLGELFPCSLECEQAKEYAERLYRATVQLGLHRLAERAKRDSLRPVALSADGMVSVVAPGTTGSLRFAWNESNH